MSDKLIKNARKPKGFSGRSLIRKMNNSHKELAEWAFSNIELKSDSYILDIGCGGGANIDYMLSLCPDGFVCGIDYSKDSVAVSKKNNLKNKNRCEIIQGDVTDLPYNPETFDFINACETVYFWPDIDKAFSGILKVLKPGGKFMIICEMSDGENPLWQKYLDTMTIFSGQFLADKLKESGFSSADLIEGKGEWFCIIASK